MGTRIQLRVYVDPGEVEASFGVKPKDNSYERVTGIIDIGAEVTLLPKHLLHKSEHRPSEQRGTFIVEQAGIARQSFEAVEAYITIVLEDQLGNITPPFEARVWFAETDIALIGFAGILDRARLHIDMLQLSGWIEFDT